MHSLPAIDQLRMLAIYAHPDDECYCSGGTLAKYSAAGAETTVISATRGQAGQINDARIVTRRTLGAVREQELRRSCAQLNITHVECWDYLDGALAAVDRDRLVRDIVAAIRRYRPHIVITFGLDGAYGHPDHIAIGQATTAAFFAASDPAYETGSQDAPHTPLRLYYAYFPERQTRLLTELASWLNAMKERFHGNLDFIHGLSLFAEESTMLNYANDFVDVRWYPPGFCIIEQGEAANDLYVILSGSVEVMRENERGELQHIADLEMGEFFGEMGLVADSRTRNAYVIARDGVTCLKFSPGEPTKFAGRGEGAVLGSSYDSHSSTSSAGSATNAIDIQDFILHKIRAISQHRTQYPIDENMFPVQMLVKLFGTEYFVRVHPRPELETTL
jgi:LmbE family N-acetylglucosaminyl deacetylase